ncbi:MAG: hypothetical protein ACP5R4_11890 [Armatimonadota bacterium]
MLAERVSSPYVQGYARSRRLKSSRKVAGNPYFLAVFSAAVVFLYAVTVLCSLNTMLGNQLTETEARLRAVEEKNALLQAKMETLRDYRRIEGFALSTGMVMRLKADVAAAPETAPPGRVVAQFRPSDPVSANAAARANPR